MGIYYNKQTYFFQIGLDILLRMVYILVCIVAKIK